MSSQSKVKSLIANSPHLAARSSLIFRVRGVRKPKLLFSGSLVAFHYSSLVFPRYLVLFRVARGLPEKLALALREQNMASTLGAL